MVKPPLNQKKTDQRGDIDSNVEFFSPSDDITTIKGTLFYHDSMQAWNTLRLKKPVIEKFKQLADKTEKGIYLMKIPNSFITLKEELERLEKNSQAVPILLFLGKEKKIEE